jgi:DNA-binding NtrC family response regulator
MTPKLNICTLATKCARLDDFFPNEGSSQHFLGHWESVYRCRAVNTASARRNVRRWTIDDCARMPGVNGSTRGVGSARPPGSSRVGTDEPAAPEWSDPGDFAEAREGLVLASPAIRSAHRRVLDAAQADARTLLLIGPTGSGKEVLAELFHRHARGSGAFVAVNCSLFGKELLRSELFGAEPGSFTGASRRIIGAVERAQGGTLFLDEIGDLPSELQPMLLRFLDRREYETLGQYGKVQRADVRVVAATNRDLREATREGTFRSDLWYRLSVHVVDVPPLRKRWDDVVAYLKSTIMGDGTTSLYDALSPAALELLRGHPWEGNFRELSNFCGRVAKCASPGSIHAASCRRALEVGSLRPIPPIDMPASQTKSAGRNWVELMARAIHAFVEDYGREPETWDDQKDWNEKYLKPLIFHELSGATPAQPPDAEALAALASQSAASVRADRGTALKQLSRYFQRFG